LTTNSRLGKGCSIWITIIQLRTAGLLPVLRRAIRGAHSRPGSKPATPLPQTASGIKRKVKRGFPKNSLTIYIAELASDGTGEVMVGGKNSLQMGRSIMESAVVCQGRTWHRMLRTGGLRWMRAFDLVLNPECRQPITEPFPEFHHPFLTTGGTEVAAFA
jgi:hypothetical protein